MNQFNTDQEAETMMRLALGRIMRMGARETQPRDAEEYENCRWIIFIDDAADEINIISMKSKHNFAAIATLFCDPVDDETTANASAIVSAVNNTYGAGINPDAVPELHRTLKNMCNYFEWLIKDPNFPAYKEAKAAIEKAKL